jgi:hypothetical protein
MVIKVRSIVQNVGKRIRMLGFCSAIIFALPVLYVLSAGPILFVAERGGISERARESLDPLYAPVGRVAKSPGIGGKALRAYFRLWVKGKEWDEDGINNAERR